MLICVQLFPETKGRTLEEIAVVFDGAEADTRVHRGVSVSTSSRAEKAGSEEESQMRKEFVKPEHLS